MASTPSGRSASRFRIGRITPPSRPSPARAPASSLRHRPNRGGRRPSRRPPRIPTKREPMTQVATDLLLEATDVAKTYGAVVALRSASLAVRPGEVHALMGANGAGKSTLVKILTGAVRPDRGRITVRGVERAAHSPGEARRAGIVSVYQEPSLVPDLDIEANLRLTRTPIEPFRRWVAELGLSRLDLSSPA